MQEIIRVNVSCGAASQSQIRLERVLSGLLDRNVPVYDGIEGVCAQGRRILFTISVDAFGADEGFIRLLRYIRINKDCLKDSFACVLIDGENELHTKAMARQLVLVANLAGCCFPGKPLTEGTGSLKNFEVRRKRMGLNSLFDAYRESVKELIENLQSAGYRLNGNLIERKPTVCMVHASEKSTSNTLAIGNEILNMLEPECNTEAYCLRNGTISDCRGCSYTVCAHYAQDHSCFYGGSITEDVFPAVLRSDVLLLLCPNYNDTISANLMAFINRMTSLTVNDCLRGKLIYAVIVSGYSGGDLVAEQVISSLCLNKAFTLPPEFCMMVTANNPGEAMALPGMEEAINAFAARMLRSISR